MRKERTSVNRNNCIDIWRLMAAIVIMVHHSTHLDGITGYPFKIGKIYVEFFYILTGYFTYVYAIRGNFARTESVIYLLHKYVTFWIYTVPYTFIVYFIHCIFFEKNESLLNVFCEAFLIVKGNNVVQLWFLVALLPVLPCFMMVSSKIQPCYMLLISFAVYVHYYFIYKFYPSHFPVFYYRAFAGVCGGVLVYHFSTFFYRMLKDRVKTQTIVFVIGNAVLLLAFILCYTNILDFQVAVICFVLGLSLLLGSKMDIDVIPLSGVAFLGRKFSFPLYVVHLPIADLVAFISRNRNHFSALSQYALYLIICGLAVAIITFVASFNEKQIDKCFFNRKKR